MYISRLLPRAHAVAEEKREQQLTAANEYEVGGTRTEWGSSVASAWPIAARHAMRGFNEPCAAQTL